MAPLRLVSYARVIPHPKKTKTGGEDAYFIAPNQHAIGVADGVGGWAAVPGGNSGRYSRELMKYCEEHSDLSSLQMLSLAYKSVDPNILGTSTAIVATLHNNMLDVLNVGDSGLIIVRNGRIIYQTIPQHRGFNCPFQLGKDSPTLPEDGHLDKFQLYPGDVIVLASDGLLDNVWRESIEKEMAKRVKGATPYQVAKRIANSLAEMAAENGKKKDFFAPFDEEAMKHGFRMIGGKLDDVTVVAAIAV